MPYASRKLKSMLTFHIVRLKTVAVKPHTFQVEGRSALLQYFNHSRNWELM
jgi:hypothetical protein